MAEDEIDLRQYLDVLIRWWREIIAITLGFVVLAVLAILTMRLVLPPQYVASADVAIVRTVSDVNFDERFKTNPETLNNDTTSLSARRSALLGMVTTGAIAQSVALQLGDQLSEKEQIPANLLEMVTGDMVTSGNARGDSDLIRISVIADTPEKSAAIANAWADQYVKEVNRVYGQVPDEVLSSIEAELTEAQQQYLNSQTNLEAFIANNRLDELNTLVTVLQQRITQEASLQSAFLLQWQETQEQLSTAHALRAQVEQGGEGAARSNMAALQILKLRAFGMTPTNLQLEVRDLPEIDQAAMMADLDGLITALEARMVDLNDKVAAGSAQLQASPTVSQTLTTALSELRTSKAALETENARQRQLTQQRDLNWETYKTLSSKVAELNLARAAASSEVRFGAAAVPPTTFEPRIQLGVGILIAGILGSVLALSIVFLSNYLNYQPFLGKTTIAPTSPFR
ncbi:MAG: hypothetical protein R3C14_06540 [Caldilineaceae bacterium]